MRNLTKTAERVYQIQNTCLRHNKEGDIETLPYVIRLIAVLALLQETGWQPQEEIRLGWFRLGTDPKERPRNLLQRLWWFFFRKSEQPIDTLERLGPIFAQLDSKEKQRLNNDAKILLIDLTKDCKTEFLETDVQERTFVNGVSRKRPPLAIANMTAAVPDGVRPLPPQTADVRVH